MSLSIDLVIPTIGRPSLGDLLASLAATVRPAELTRPPTVYLVDDRPVAAGSLAVADMPLRIETLASGGRGPAAARNLGWRAAGADWVVFLDDDVRVSRDWWPALLHDLRSAPESVAGVQGRIVVPLPGDRRPTDFERTTAGLQTGRWITADLAYRRSVLEALGGFDERFPAAFREDSDLALRMLAAGHRLVTGDRLTVHPVRPAGRWVSVRQQRGNADDVLMRRLHGRGWRLRAGAPVGRFPQHAVVVAALGYAVLARRSWLRRLAGLVWIANWAEFSWRRIGPGPGTPTEVATMLVTSAAIPPVACWHRLAGAIRHRSVRPAGQPEAVLLDRDGTIVVDEPYNGDPGAVRPMPGTRRALRRLRRAGIPIAVVSNQSGIGRGLLTESQVAAVNHRIEELLGPFDGWFVCPHTEQDGCDCRKPAPGLVLAAAQALGVSPQRCVLVGDIGADVAAAGAAGARSILVPTGATRPDEITAASCVASDLPAAVERILAGDLPAGHPAPVPLGGG